MSIFKGSCLLEQTTTSSQKACQTNSLAAFREYELLKYKLQDADGEQYPREAFAHSSHSILLGRVRIAFLQVKNLRSYCTIRTIRTHKEIILHFNQLLLHTCTLNIVQKKQVHMGYKNHHLKLESTAIVKHTRKNICFVLL
jgi:hypothetical protein